MIKHKPQNIPSGWKLWSEEQPKYLHTVIGVAYYLNSDNILRKRMVVGYSGRNGVFESYIGNYKPYLWMYADDMAQNFPLEESDIQAIEVELKNK